MLYIDANCDVVIEAKKQFHQAMQTEVYKRIDRLSDPEVKIFFDTLVNEHIDMLLVGNPQELIALHQSLNPLVHVKSKYLSAVVKVFDYEWFTEKKERIYDAYELAKSLNITTCTYCNRNYTNTIITRKGEKISRPQFDHYFDKGTHPLLALSFFNLIPSCSTCNSSVKHGKHFLLTTHVHPYVDDTIDSIRISYLPDRDANNYVRITVRADSCARTQKNIDDFALEEVYNVHTDLLLDLLKKRYAFSDRYLSILGNGLLSSLNVSRQELYRLAFGTELNTVDFVKRPFSKFNRDILTELELL